MAPLAVTHLALWLVRRELRLAERAVEFPWTLKTSLRIDALRAAVEALECLQ